MLSGSGPRVTLPTTEYARPGMKWGAEENGPSGCPWPGGPLPPVGSFIHQCPLGSRWPHPRLGPLLRPAPCQVLAWIYLCRTPPRPPAP